MGERIRHSRSGERREADIPGGVEPFALRAIKASVTRRRALVSSADRLVRSINTQLDGPSRNRQSPTPPDLPSPHRAEREVEIDEALQTARRRKLAGLAFDQVTDLA